MRRRGLCLVAGLALSATACVETRPKSFVASSVPPAPEQRSAAPVPPPPPQTAPVLPPGLPSEGSLPKTITPAEAVDLALRNNPATRETWYRARSAAAGVGSRLSAWYPTIEVDGQITRQKQFFLGSSSYSLTTTLSPSVNLTWLLLDFGGRAADVEESRAFLAVANASHDAVLNNVILQVLQAYYLYEGAKSLLAAQEASLKQAKENLKAAEERHRAGVATIADVLQAKTTASQQQLAVDTVRGQIAVIRGALATSLGVPANTPVEAGELPEELNLDRVTQTVDELIAMAEKQRPDLAATRYNVVAAQSHVKSLRSALLPTLAGAASTSWTYYGSASAVPYVQPYLFGLLLRIPVFTGFQREYDLLQARQDEKAAEAAAASLEQQVVQQVWSSYYSVKTAAQTIRTARDLVASARQSADVTRGRYTAGVGSILDLLTAESALASARAQDVQARAAFLFSLAQLARDVGLIEQAVKEAP